MGYGGIGVWQLLIVLVIVLLLFVTKRLRNIGSDLGNAVKGFKCAMNKEGEEAKDTTEKLEKQGEDDVIEGEVTSKTKDKENS